MGRFLLVLGLAIALIGLLIMWGLPIGRLRGDVVVRRGNFSFYFPIVSCLLLSVILTLVLALFRR